MAQTYRDLIFWQKGVRLAVLALELTKTFPRDDVYGLSSQLKRAAIAIPSKIAEGHGRLSTQDYRYCLGLARGAIFEVQTHLTIARELNFSEPSLIDEVEGLSNEVGKMITSTLSTLAVNREP